LRLGLRIRIYPVSSAGPFIAALIGQTASHYKILSKFGEGGMGVVCKTEDAEVNLAVEPKGIPSVFLASPTPNDHLQPTFLLIPFNTLLTQTLLTPRCRASSVWFKKGPLTGILAYVF